MLDIYLHVLTSKLKGLVALLQRYSVIIFIIFIALLYGFLGLQIDSLSSVEPSSNDVTNQVNAAQITHIDPLVVFQLQTLRDNSVSVQGLLNKARSNPFQ